MKSLKITASIVALLSASCLSASASDLLSLKDTPATLSDINWNGCYFSAGGGATFAKSHVSTAAGNIDLGLSGGNFDGRIGCDRTIGKGILFGVFGELGGLRDVNGTVNAVSGTSIAQRYNWKVGARTGVEIGNAMPYVLAAFTHEDVEISGPTKGLDGGTVGAGVEIKIPDSNWRIALEGSYSVFEDANLLVAGNKFKASNDEEKIGLRLSWYPKF